MSTHASQCPDAAFTKASAARDTVTFKMFVNVGATGAPSLAAATGTSRGGADDPGLTITRASTGLYNLGYPKGKNAWIQVSLIDSTNAVVGTNFAACTPTSGTAQFRVLGGTNAAAVTDPPNGAAMMITIEVER